MKIMKKSITVLSIIGAVCFALSCNQVEQAPKVVNKKLPNGGEVNGPRSIENIDIHIKQLQPRFDFFYKKHKKLNPDLEGIIELIFEIDEKGNVFYFEIATSTTKAPEFEDEILHAVANHKFGEWTAGKGNTEVIIPLKFSGEVDFEPQKKLEL